MKKIVTLFLLSFALLILLPVAAMAEEVAGFGELAPYTWATLATVAGATAATLLIVQYIKAPLDKMGHLPTRVLVYVIALLILLGAQAFTEGFTWSGLPLVLVNAFVVALAAMGSYETFTPDKSTEPPDGPDNLE